MTVLVVEKPIAPSVDAASFKLAMRNTAASVNVITCGSDEGDFGLTATAFSSVTADPPTVLIAVNSGASIYPHLLKQRRFAVNVLSADALQVSNDFAGGLPPEERFARHAWTRLSSGNPALAASSAGFDCVVTELSQVGSHLVVLGRVEHCWYSDQQSLLYSNGRYGRFV